MSPLAVTCAGGWGGGPIRSSGRKLHSECAGARRTPLRLEAPGRDALAKVLQQSRHGATRARRRHRRRRRRHRHCSLFRGARWSTAIHRLCQRRGRQGRAHELLAYALSKAGGDGGDRHGTQTFGVPGKDERARDAQKQTALGLRSVSVGCPQGKGAARTSVPAPASPACSARLRLTLAAPSAPGSCQQTWQAHNSLGQLQGRSAPLAGWRGARARVVCVCVPRGRRRPFHVGCSTGHQRAGSGHRIGLGANVCVSCNPPGHALHPLL